MRMKLKDFPFRPYQKDTITNLMRKERFHALLIEVGGGKSLCIIGYAETHKKIKKVIIFCRKDNIKTWRDEIKKWRGSKYVQVKGTPSLRLHNIMKFFSSNKYKYLIINYDAPKCRSKKIDGVGNIKYRKVIENEIYTALMENKHLLDYAVFDESIEIKNGQSDRHRYVYRITKDIDHKAILDGCPVSTSPMDLYGQFLMLDGGRTFGDNFFRFRNKYFQCTNIGYQTWVLKNGGLEAMHTKMAKVAVRIKKRDVRDDLPPQAWQKYHGEMKGKQLKYYKQMAEWFWVDDDDIYIETKHTIVQLQKLHQICNGFLYMEKGKPPITFPHPKPEMLRKVLGGELRGKPQLVIWANHLYSLKEIKQVCKTMGRSSIIYHGGLSDKQKESRRDKFLANKVDIFIGQARAGVGLNELANADTTIYWSNAASLRARVQTEGRIDRDSTVVKERNLYLDFVIANSLEQHIYDSIRMKQWSSDSVLNFKSRAEIRKVIT